MTSDPLLVLSPSAKRKCSVVDSDGAAKRLKHSNEKVPVFQVETANTLPVSDDETDIGANLSDYGTPLTPSSAKDWPSLKKTIRCTFPDCDKLFNRQAKLRDHLRSHSGDKPFSCSDPACDKSFARKTHLDRHVKSAHTDVRDYECSFAGCSKAFSTGTRLRRHEASHTQNSQFRCTQCDQIFRKHATLQKHTATTHNGRKAFICQQVHSDGTPCSAGFDRSSGLNNHMARVHGTPKYSCTICQQTTSDGNNSARGSPASFTTYTEFKEHNRTVHPPTCVTCGSAYDSEKQLRRHLEIDHGQFVHDTPSEIAPAYVCTEFGCGRGFSKKGNLQVHIRNVHTQARPFVCGETTLEELNNVHGWDGKGACSRTFKAKAHLEEHIRTIHMGLDHRFKARRVRGRHAELQRHSTAAQEPRNYLIGKLTGIDPRMDRWPSLLCRITGCQAKFVRLHDLNEHLKTRHGLDESEIRVWNLPEPGDGYGESLTTEFDELMMHDNGEDNLMIKENEFEDEEDREFASLEQAAEEGGQFWLGDESYPDRGGSGGIFGKLSGLSKTTDAAGNYSVVEDNDSGGYDIDDDDDDDDDDPNATLWEAEQAEMEQLIGAGHGWEDDVFAVES